MDYVRNLRDRIPAVDRLSLLALVVMIVVGLADVFFVTRLIVPPLQERSDLQSQLALAKEDLDTARKAQESTPDELRKQVEAAQAKLDDVAAVFLSDSQASEALNRLYRYAIESEVEITDLQTQPTPSEEEKSAYDVRRFRLQASAILRNLVDFVSRIEEAALESFVISDVNITDAGEQSTLDMNIALYTSPYSSGATASPTPSPTVVAEEDLTQMELMLARAWASEDWEEAIDLIEQILAIDPDYPDMTEKLYSAHVNYGRQLLDEGDPDEAATEFNSALEIKPDGVEAQAGLEQAAAWVPTPTPVVVPTSTPPRTLTVEEQLEQRLHESWAVASDDDKRAEEWEEVIGLIEQIRAVNPARADMTEKLYAAHVNYGIQLVAEGRLEEAKTEFTRALNVKPDGEEAEWELEALAASATPVPATTSVPTATPQSQQGTIHVVKSGENLYRISLQYGTTVDAIMAANGLTSTAIYVGQQLYIPAR
jgi:tetratricopeptide (TPR) repeat protein